MAKLHTQYEVAIWREDGNEQDADHIYFEAGRGGAGYKAALALYDRTIAYDDLSIELRKIISDEDGPISEVVLHEKTAQLKEDKCNASTIAN
jgi:hypothetical protein